MEMHSVLSSSRVCCLVISDCVTPWTELILPDGETSALSPGPGLPCAQSLAVSSPSEAKRAGTLCPQTWLLGLPGPVMLPRPASLEGRSGGGLTRALLTSLLPPEPLLREASVVFAAGIYFPAFGSQYLDLEGGGWGRNHNHALGYLDRVKLTVG